MAWQTLGQGKMGCLSASSKELDSFSVVGSRDDPEKTQSGLKSPTFCRFRSAIYSSLAWSNMLVNGMQKTQEQFLQKRKTLFSSSLQTLSFNIKYTSMKPPIKEVDLCCFDSPIIFGVTIHHRRTCRNHVVSRANTNESLWHVCTKVRNGHLRGYYGHFFQL